MCKSIWFCLCLIYLAENKGNFYKVFIINYPTQMDLQAIIVSNVMIILMYVVVCGVSVAVGRVGRGRRRRYTDVFLNRGAAALKLTFRSIPGHLIFKLLSILLSFRLLISG